MIPASVVDRVDPNERTVYLRMSKEDVKNAPDYDADRKFGDQQSDLDEYYGTTAGHRSR